MDPIQIAQSLITNGWSNCLSLALQDRTHNIARVMIEADKIIRLNSIMKWDYIVKDKKFVRVF